MHAVSDLAVAAYCPRKLYYRRRDDDPYGERDARHELPFRYDELLDPGTDLADEPLAVSPVEYRSNLGQSRARVGPTVFDALRDPAGRDAFLEGRRVRGVAHKVLDEPLAPSLVVAGEPPETGVWEPQVVRAVALARALEWERQEPVERAYVEYAAHGVVRELELTARRTGAFRRALRTVDTMDGPPARTRQRSKCESCEYRGECGVRTRSLRSLLRLE
jgi:CRISPR-associated exonuclease Cas4